MLCGDGTGGKDEKTATSMMLSWAPRAVNKEADTFTNQDFTGFNPGLRRELDMNAVKWVIMDRLFEAAASYNAEKERIKQEVRHASGAHGSQRTRQRKRNMRLKDTQPW